MYKIAIKLRSSFEITLKELDCTGGVNDEGNQQMYGNLEYFVYNNGVITSGGYLWGPYNGSSYKTASGNKIAIDKSVTVTLDETNPNDYVLLRGYLWEYDLSDFDADEVLGAASINLYLKDLNAAKAYIDAAPSAQLLFNGDGDLTSANFAIVPID